MRSIRVVFAIFLLAVTIVPARADFKYTETSQITGGALVGAMKVASVFARGDAKKALQPITTTHYLKGNRLRTDRADGTAEIIDLDGPRVIAIDFNKKTYAVATFEQIKAAMEQAQQRMQEEMAKNPKKQQMQDTQVKVTPTIHVTPGTGSRVILDQPTKETKVQMDVAMQATDASAPSPSPGQPTAANMTMDMDTFVAPGVAEYQEFAQFYRRMAQDVNWMKMPAMMNVQVDPRMAQGMSELQKNSDALKGFPLLSYVSMSMAATGSDGKPISQDNAQKQPSNPPPSRSNSDESIDNPSAAVMKGLGGLFGKKKQQDNAAAQTSTPPPNPNANPNALMEMTTQVTSFSASSLDGGLFDVPGGFMQVQEDPMQVFGGGAPSQPAKK